MAKAWVPYVVQQGDHLDKLAFRHGVEPEALWSYAKNRELAERRPNPDTLCPGDVLFVPAEPTPALPLEVGTTNAYRARVPKLRVKLHLAVKRDLQGLAYEVAGAGAKLEGSVGADNTIELALAVSVREITIRIPDAGLVVSARVGDLDPIEEPSGIAQRLGNLGYLPRAAHATPPVLAGAIRSFQRDQGIAASGEVDDATRDALAKAHRV